MDSTLLLVSVIVLIALAFDFINGFHDAANSIATVVSTRVLTPRLAVAWAAFEMPKGLPTRYRAGIDFGTAADGDGIAGFADRNKKD